MEEAFIHSGCTLAQWCSGSSGAPPPPFGSAAALPDGAAMADDDAAELGEVRHAQRTGADEERPLVGGRRGLRSGEERRDEEKMRNALLVPSVGNQAICRPIASAGLVVTMGAAASALPDKVDRPTIEKLAGGSFDAGKFDELNKLSLADEDGVVARDDFIAFAEASAAGAGDDATAAASSASNVGTAAATAAEKDGDDAAAVDTVGELKTTPQPSAPSERRRSSLERGASTKNQLTFGLAVPVDGSVATTTTVGVRVVRSEKLKQFVRVISGSPALLSKHALVAIELDQISDADAAAQRATRQKALRAQAAAALARFEVRMSQIPAGCCEGGGGGAALVERPLCDGPDGKNMCGLAFCGAELSSR